MLRIIELGNILDAYSITNTMKLDTSNDTQKHSLWMQHVAWHCNSYSSAPISDYINNPVFQELLHKSKYFDNDSDEKVLMDDELEAWKECTLNVELAIWVEGKKKEVAFLSNLGTLAKPLLVLAAGAIGGEILKGLGSREGGHREEEDEDRGKLAMLRNNILLQRLSVPKSIQLPSSRIVHARCQKVGRHVLNPTRVRTTRTYVRKIVPWRQRIRRLGPRNQRRRRQQAGRGLDVATAFDQGKKAAGSKLSKMLINDAIDCIPTAYINIKNKMRNKKVKTVLDTGIDDYFVNKGIDLIGEQFN